MKRIVVKVLAWIGGVTVLGVGGILILVLLMRGGEDVPERTVLTVDFERQTVEYVPEDPFARLAGSRTLVVRDVVEALERASGDGRVVGLLARVGSTQMGLAQIQEIRDAVLAFRRTGKPAVAYAETFGELGTGNGGYYLASAFGKVYLQPSGDIGLTGLVYEHPFLKGTLDKLGIVPRLDHREDYKNAMNLFTEEAYTEAHREATETVMRSQFGQMMRGIAESLVTSEEEVTAVVNRAPILGTEAVDAHLVDGLAYRDEVYKKMKAEAGEDVKFVEISDYLERAGRPHTDGAGIALIYGVGMVVRGKSGYDPAMGEQAMGSDTVAGAIRAAVKDRDVKAIVFRVDSPGGSYVASDAIWRETVKAREAGKPVIVSMGNVAGSGGYFVAMRADKIVAQPGTITGSIGVVGGKMLTSAFWEKMGITWDEVHAGENATMWTGIRDYTPAQWARFQALLDRIYEDFTSKVAEGRHMSREEVLEVAKGRIWTGEDALALGLVDELGGFSTALRLAREGIGVPEDAPVELKLFPKRKSLLELILERGRQGMTGETAVLARALEVLRPALRLARAVGLGPQRGVLAMPEVGEGNAK